MEKIYAGDYPNVGQYLLALGEQEIKDQYPRMGMLVKWAKENVEKDLPESVSG